MCLPACDANGQCAEGFVCAEGFCTPEEFCLGKACDEDSACESGACQAGWCEPPQICDREVDCGPDRRCDGGRCVPTRALCREANDCPRGELCVGGRCEPGEAPRQACEPCEDALDCGAPALCADLGEGRNCLAVCRDDCPGGLQCTQVGEGFAVCLDPFEQQCVEERCGQDPLEPNDDLERASRLAAIRGEVRGLVCDGDVDVFELEDARGDRRLTLAPEGPVVLRAFTDDGEPSTVIEVRRETTFEVRSDTAYAWIESSQGVEVAYTIDLRAEGPPMDCRDDNLEPNNDRDAATAIGNGAMIRATACPGDPDWYRVRIRGGQEGPLNIAKLGDGNLVYRLEQEGEAPEDGEAGGETALQLDGRGGRVWIRLTCDDCDGGLEYTLSTSFD